MRPDLQFELQVLTLENRERKPLFTGAYTIYDPSWDFKSDAATFVASRSADPNIYDIYWSDLFGNLRQVTDIRGFLSEPAFSRDGQMILFVKDRSGAPNKGLGKICSVPVIGGAVTIIDDTKRIN